MASGFQAGAIVGSLVLDKTKWTQSVTGAKKDTKSLTGMSDKMSAGFKKAGKAMTIAGAAIVGTLGTMVKKYVETGDWIDKMSKRTGFAATTLSELAYAANISGASLDDVEKGVKRMSKTIVDAGDGMATYVRAFDRLGLKVEDIEKLGIEEQFSTIAKAIAEVESPTIRAAAAQDIFGRAGTKLLPLFAEGEKGLEALSREAHELGIIFDKEAAAKAAKLKDAQTALKESFKGLGFTLSESLVPVLTKLVDKVTEVMKKVIAWVKENPKLTETIVKITGGVGALMLALGPLAVMLPGLIKMFGALTGPIGLVSAALVILGAKAIQAGKDFKTSMDLYQKESDLTGKKVGWLEKILQSGRAAWDKLSYGVDTNKIALQAYNEQQRKAQGVMSIVTGTSKILSGGVKFLSDKWQELADILPGAEEGTGGVNEKIKYTVEIAETAAQNIGILTSSMGEFAFKTVSTQKVLENLKPAVTEVFAEAIPPARDFGHVLDQVPIKLKDMERTSEETGTAIVQKTGEIKSIWTEVSTILSDTARKWGDMFVETLGIAEAFTYQMKEFDNSYWQNAIMNATEGYDKKKQFLEDSLEDQEGYYTSIIDNANKDYEQKKKHIEASVKDEEEKMKLLDQLEIKHQLDLEKYRTDQKVKEETLRTDLVKLEEDYQGEIDQLKKDEAIAMEEHRKDELEKQESFWNTTKGIIGTVLEDIVKMWLTKFIGKILTGTSGLVETIGGAAKDVVSGFKSIAKSVGTGVTQIGGGLLGSVIGGGVAGLVSGLMTKGGGIDTTDKWHFKHIWLNTNALPPMEGAIYDIRNWTKQTAIQTEGVPKKLDLANRWLDKIAGSLKKMSGVSAQSGLDMAITKPTMIMTHPGEHATITPANQVRHGDMSFAFNITAGDSRDMERWLRDKGARMIEDIVRQNLGGNAERMEANLARYRRR